MEVLDDLLSESDGELGLGLGRSSAPTTNVLGARVGGTRLSNGLYPHVYILRKCANPFLIFYLSQKYVHINIYREREI